MKEKFMKMAIAMAEKGMEMGEVPIGAVIVKDGEVISSACNMRENGGGATAHAELLAINKACEVMGGWRLGGCELYVTLEPCPMCAGAIINSRLDRVVFGARDPRAGAFGSMLNINSYPLGHKTEVEWGVCEDQCLALLRSFFEKMRERKE